MRIVYDDSKAAQAVEQLRNFMCGELDPWNVVREENFMLRVQKLELRSQLNKFWERFGFQIGDRVTHAYGIGNNSQYLVYYKADGELQQCCSVNINVDPFGIGYVSLEDYNGKRISDLYEVTSRSVQVKN